MKPSLEQAFFAISDLRARVDVDDDYLRDVIRRVESVFSELRPIPLDLPYRIGGSARHVELRQSRGGRWHVAWRDDYHVDTVALLSAPRSARAEVFTPIDWSDGRLISPLEALVIGVMEGLVGIVAGREVPIRTAQRLQAVLDAWSTHCPEGKPT